MNTIAESYVKLVLAVGRHDEDYVDAYHGPKDWQDGVKKSSRPLLELHDSALRLIERLQQYSIDQAPEIELLRYKYLMKHSRALHSRIEALQGKKFSFDEESQAYYDAVAPHYAAEYFENILRKMDSLLPGQGSVPERYESYRRNFIIPVDKLDRVFQSAIRECRMRTKRYIALPESENFSIEYVNNKPWSGYNWYKGNCFSLIQVNTDLPIFIDRAIDLAAHEGYPGHHVYNSLLELQLYRSRGWAEFSVFPLFSPQALIAEGTANHGIEVVFTSAARLAFEQEVLFSEAGLDPSSAGDYYELYGLYQMLSHAGNEAARGYLDGKLNPAQAVDWLVTYGLFSRERAEQRLRFFEKYRSYVINYNLGQDLVRSYLEKKCGHPASPETRWKQFEILLSTPLLPSALKN